MTESVRVNVSRISDADAILGGLAARGFDGTLDADEAGLSVVLAGERDSVDRMRRDLWLALEDAIAERRLPLVPLHDADGILLRPAFV